jgi:hypothetical protein
MISSPLQSPGRGVACARGEEARAHAAHRSEAQGAVPGGVIPSIQTLAGPVVERWARLLGDSVAVFLEPTREPRRRRARRGAEARAWGRPAEVEEGIARAVMSKWVRERHGRWQPRWSRLGGYSWLAGRCAVGLRQRAPVSRAEPRCAVLASSVRAEGVGAAKQAGSAQDHRNGGREPKSTSKRCL